MWNGGRGFLEGPILGTLEDVFIGIPTDIGRGRYKAATRKAFSKLGAPGRIISEQLKN